MIRGMYMGVKNLVISFVIGVMLGSGLTYGARFISINWKSVSKEKKKAVVEIPTVAAQVTKDQLKDIEDCYTSRIQNGLSKKGRLKLSWFVNDQGRAENIELVDNELSDEDLYECSIAAISHWSFPENKPFNIQYTFNLIPRDAENFNFARKTASE